MEEKIVFSGELEIYVRDLEKEEDWKLIRKEKNIITNSFLDRVLDTALPNSYNYFAIGDNNSTPSASDTTLNNEVFRKAVSSITKDTSSGYKQKYQCFLTTTDYTGNIAEFGLFDAASAGNMLNHVVFDSFYKSSSMEVRFDYYLTVDRI